MPLRPDAGVQGRQLATLAAAFLDNVGLEGR